MAESNASRVTCTSCHSAVDSNKCLIHQVLKVLQCQKCEDFYNDGEWRRDDEGQDEYCRWCAQGGNLYICASESCLRGFCKKCILRNLGRAALEAVENDDDWLCFVCNSEPLKLLQEQAALIVSPERHQLDHHRNKVLSLSKKLTSSFDTLKANWTDAKVVECQKDLASNLKKLQSALDKTKVWLEQVSKNNNQVEYITKNTLTFNRSQASSNKQIQSSDCLKIESGDHKRISLGPTSESDKKERRRLFIDLLCSDDDDADAKKTEVNGKVNGSSTEANGSPSVRPKCTGLSSPPVEERASSRKKESSPLQRSAVSTTSKHSSSSVQIEEIHEDGESDCVFLGSANNPNCTVDEPDDDDEVVNKTGSCESLSSNVSTSRKSPDETERDTTGESSTSGAKGRKNKISEEKTVEAEEDDLELPEGFPSIKNLEDSRWHPNVCLKRLAEPGKERARPLCKKDRVVDADPEEEAEQTSAEDKDDDEEDSDIDYLLGDVVKRKCRETIPDQKASGEKRGRAKKDRGDKGVTQKKSTNSDEEDGSDEKEVIASDNESIEFHHIPDASKEEKESLSRKSSPAQSPVSSLFSNSEEEVDTKVAKGKQEKSKSNSEKAGSEEKSDREQSGEEERKMSDSEDNVASRRKLRRIPKLVSDKSDSEAETKESAKTKKRTTRATRKRALVLDSDDEESISKKNKLSDGSNAEKSDLEDLELSSASEEEEDGKDDKKKGKADGKKKKKIKFKGSDSEESDDEKPRRRKKKTKEDADGDAEENDDESPSKGRKSVRKIMTDDKIEKDTRQAAREEAERRKRVLERQKLYNQIEEELGKNKQDDDKKRCILEIDTETKDVLVEVDAGLVKSMKPHQFDGIKFLYNTVIESLQQLEKPTKPDASYGAILAHCMGLGKTFQSICFIHTLLTHPKLNKHIKRVMVVAPCNVLLNWAKEFEGWIENDEEVAGEIPVYEFSKVKTIQDRAYLLEQWFDNGGVLIIGYSMYRLMSTSKIRQKKLKEKITQCLHEPGPDLVICDEGHLLKSSKSQIAVQMQRIATKRRIILTGTPLQNNMNEYHCMVSFVKPKLLGTVKEFNNRFMNPITHGQEASASPLAVKIMKKRVHILNKLLCGCVHRCDYSHLTPYLAPKFEYILSIDLCELQKKLYSKYLESIGISETTSREELRSRSLLKDYSILKLVWTHPHLLLTSADRQEEKRIRDCIRNELEDFVVDSDEPSMSDSSDDVKDDKRSDKSGGGKSSSSDDSSSEDEVVKKYSTRRQRYADGEPVTESEEEVVQKDRFRKAWWRVLIPQEDEEKIHNIEVSSKLGLALHILKQCELIGDKVILFSTSILTLNYFEQLLEITAQEAYNKHQEEKGGEGEANEDYIYTWTHGFDYFRLDGSTSLDLRKKYIEAFNDAENLRARLFLVSTKAGGIGTNMVGANRIIMLDASWNPSDDTQAIFRAFRYGQTKPVYVYRLLSHGTMEEKIYDRQVNKISLASRVVDEQNLERHFDGADLAALYNFKPDTGPRKEFMLPKDRLLAELLLTHKDQIVKYHEHDSLLQKELDDELTEEERKAAWKEYEDERDGKTMPQNFAYGQQGYYPNMPGMAGRFPQAGMPFPGAGTSANQFPNMPQNIQALINRPPHFNFKTSHPTLDLQKILMEAKIRHPYADQLTIASQFKMLLESRRMVYARNLQTNVQTVQAYERMKVTPPRVVIETHNQCVTAIKILNQVIPKLQQTIEKGIRSYEEARRRFQESSGSQQPNAVPIIEIVDDNLDDDDIEIVSETPGNRYVVEEQQTPGKAPPPQAAKPASGPIIEEIE